MLPGILNHLGSDGLSHLRKIASEHRARLPADDEEVDIPDLVQNFENAMGSKENNEVNVDEAIETKQVPTETVD